MTGLAQIRKVQGQIVRALENEQDVSGLLRESADVRAQIAIQGEAETSQGLPQTDEGQAAQ